ncbi:MAG: aminotransferase class I/II-fold pyridoxal phosphate-dependent enzyme [Candidatus Omnitrophota bacterium]|jgi:aminotransferase|nr:MAG: aminotransferase class I/II-fold pyridoxal phosphate-dependent enzyme [Candidatus Omnitrophota bacterium]
MKPAIIEPIFQSQSRINQDVADLPPSGIRRFFDLAANTPGVISLGVGEPDFATPWHISEAGIHALEMGQTSYTSNSGMPRLREEVSAYFERIHHCRYDPAGELLITIGGSEGLDLSFRALLNPGEEAIIVDPSFVSYAPLAILAGGKAIRIPTTAENGFVPRREHLEKALSPRTKILVVNYPNNPTGATLTMENVEEIADFVLRSDLILVSDEIYLPLSYETKGISFTSIPELREQLVLLHGFSKAWAMTGWRLGIAAGPRDIIAAMTKIHQYSIMCASSLAQIAAIEALKNGADEVERMRREYDARRRFIASHFNRLGLDCFIPKGAFYVFPSIRRTGLSSEEFALRLLEDERVAVVPGTAFGECGEGHIRCSYATSLEEIREAINHIEHFLTKNHPEIVSESLPLPYREEKAEH